MTSLWPQREAVEAADRKRREEDAAEVGKWAAQEAEDRRRLEEGERALVTQAD